VCQVLDPPFVPQGGFGWLIRNITLTEDDVFSHYDRSRLVLLENGRPLGHPHARHITIKQRGKGRFPTGSDFSIFPPAITATQYQWLPVCHRPSASAGPGGDLFLRTGRRERWRQRHHPGGVLRSREHRDDHLRVCLVPGGRRSGAAPARPVPRPVVILSPPDNITDEAPEYDRVIDAERRSAGFPSCCCRWWICSRIGTGRWCLPPGSARPGPPQSTSLSGRLPPVRTALGQCPFPTASNRGGGGRSACRDRDRARRRGAAGQRLLACQAGLSEPRPPERLQKESFPLPSVITGSGRNKTAIYRLGWPLPRGWTRTVSAGVHS